MKLRIRGNSIRLRLTKGEVERFANGEPVEETIDLTPVKFVYELCVGEVESITASFDGGRMTVSVPELEAREWASTETVGMEAGDRVRVLIEKDFACVKPRAGEDESDMFDHPTATAC